MTEEQNSDTQTQMTIDLETVEEVLAALPPAVREALEAEASEVPNALKKALEQLPPAEVDAVVTRLREIGILDMGDDPGIGQALHELDALLRAIAAVALGNSAPRAQIEAVLPRLEEDGWRITDAVHQLWDGVRDEAALVKGLDMQDAALIHRILELISTGVDAPESGDGASPPGAETSGETARAEQVLRQFLPLLKAAAAVANGDEGPKAAVEQTLAEAEKAGFHVLDAIQRIWKGERDAVALTEGLDEMDRQIIKLFLEVIPAEAGLAEKRQALLATLPPSILKALEIEGEQAGEALKAALAQLPPAEAREVLARLEAAGVISTHAGKTPDELIRYFDPLLQAIVAVANGNEVPRDQLEPVLTQLDGQGWMLSPAVHRIWEGERDEAALTQGIDPNSALLIRQLLARLKNG